MTTGEAETLTAFAEARLAEDKDRAEGLLFACKLPDKAPDFGSCGGPAAEAYWEHFGPRRMLREVEAKRAVLAAAFEYEAKLDGEWGCAHNAEEIAAGQCRLTRPEQMSIVRAVLATWDTHPDYRQAWKP